MTKMLFTGGLALAIAALATPPARAGEHLSQTVTVWISSTSKSASGNIADVHNSSSPNELLGCEVRGYDTYMWGFCFARDAAGTWLSCSTTKDYLIRAMSTINGDSELGFTVNSGAGCTGVLVTNGSRTRPKNHGMLNSAESAAGTEPPPGTIGP